MLGLRLLQKVEGFRIWGRVWLLGLGLRGFNGLSGLSPPVAAYKMKI